MKGIGDSVPLIRGEEIATGRLNYVTDLKAPGMLFGRILRSPIPHGKILNIDFKKALRVPGVKAVLTGRETPQQKFGPLLEDWEILATQKVRFVGDEVVAVAASDPDAAEEALWSIHAEYEALPAVFDPREAMDPAAPLIHEKERNIAMVFEVERGDIKKGFETSDFIYENSFSSPQIYHAYLEPNGCLAEQDGQGRVTLTLPTQTPAITRVMYAKALGLPLDKLRLVIPPYGGAFGGKQVHNLHLAACLLAMKTGKPVKMVIDREEDFISGNPKVNIYMDVKIGARKDGKLLAKEVRVIGGAGGRVVFSPIIVSTAGYRIDSLYKFENLKTLGYTVYTNETPTAAFRGFGNPESVFAVESSIDMVARELGVDPLEMRIMNGVKSGDVTTHGWKITSCGLEECIRKAAERAQYRKKRENPKLNRGIGMACCNHVSGNRLIFRDFDGSSALVKIGRDGDVTLIHGESDMGQGLDTVLAQIAAGELGIPMTRVRVAQVDTETSPFSLGCISSRGTFFGGNAVKKAAEHARSQLFEVASELLEADPLDLSLQEERIFVKGTPDKAVSFQKAVQELYNRRGGMPVIGMGFYKPNTEIPDFKTKYGNISPAYPFACHVAEVEVDRETGIVRVIRYVAAHDIGKAINPMLAEGQVEGGVAQGLGFALMEEIKYEKGRIGNPNFLDYVVPGPSDLPPIDVIFVETNDPEGPYGGKGVGEPALNPVAGAIANAIYDAVGIRVTELPMTPERLRALIRARDKELGPTGSESKGTLN